MRVLVLLSLLALCTSAFAVRDDGALQPNLPSNEDDDAFLEALSANMNINEDLDNEINALDDVKSADELKEKATEIADKLAEMKAQLDEEEARSHKRRRREDVTQDQVVAAMKAIIEKGADCDWNKCGEKFYMRVFESKNAADEKFKNRVIVATPEGQWVRAFHDAKADDAKARATAWCTDAANVDVKTPPDGWASNGAAWVKGDLVRVGYGCFEVVNKPPKKDELLKKINDGFKPWVDASTKDCKKCADLAIEKTEQQQQKKKEQPQQQQGAKKEQPPQQQQGPKKEQPQPQQQGPKKEQPQQQQQAPKKEQQNQQQQAPKDPSKQQKDDASVDDEDEEDLPQQQQPQQPQASPQPQQPQASSPQQQQPQQQQQGKSKQGQWHMDKKEQQNKDKKDQPKKEQQRKDKKDQPKKEQQRKDKKEQHKEHKQEQQDKAAVAARVAKLKKHGFSEVSIDGKNFLVGEVHYTNSKKVEKVKTVITDEKGNYMKEINEEHEPEEIKKKFTGKTEKLSSPPKNYEAADANKFFVRTTDKKTFVRANFYPFGLRHCSQGSKLDTCIAKKKALLQKQGDEADKAAEEKQSDAEVNPEAETQPDAVEAEVAPQQNENEDGEDM